MQTPCAFARWPGFPEPQVCAPGLVRTVSKASVVLLPSQPPAGRRGRLEVPPAVGVRVSHPGPFPRVPRGVPEKRVSAFLHRCTLALSPGPAHSGPACARGPKLRGQGLLWATSAHSGPGSGERCLAWGTRPASPFTSEPLPPCSDAACRDFVCASFRLRRALRRKPSVGTHGDVAGGGLRGFRSPLSLFVGRQSPRLDSASGGFPSLFSVRGSAASISLALTVVPGNRGAGVWPHRRAFTLLLLSPRLLSSLWWWFVFDPGRSGLVSRGPCFCPVVFLGAVAVVTWPSIVFSRYLMLLFKERSP
ncbi:uncharacterized protein LOC131823216 [Mustela lutreola]|uniref:uncharacterized protein LOC131823216 n=1 Tax=Mustela lutreola TaxID=9666 RepID=UPI0027973999|nr:uncharacterized protein LOC131823216 [Mustela lutreola]